MIRKTDLEHTGYVRVRLSQGGTKFRASVHRIVAEAFHGPQPTPEHQVAHNDGNRQNNRADNLRWTTCKDNLADRRRHGTEMLGERNGRAKLTTESVIAIRESRASSYELALRYGVSPMTIQRVRRGANWGHV